MKKKILGLAMGLLLVGFNVFAADGDLIVNGNLGIGTTAPTEALQVNRSAAGNSMIQIINDYSTSAAQALFRVTTDEGTVSFGASASGHSFPKALIWSNLPNRDLVFATNSSEKMRVTSGGNVGIGTTSPANILSIMQYSTYDPVADAWTIYPCDRTTKDIIRTLPSQSGALDRLLEVQLYEWKRKPLVSDDEIKSRFEGDMGVNDLEEKRQELSDMKSNLPKFQAKRLGIMLDDPNIPDEIISIDGAGNKGLDLVGYIGWLHATIKDLALRVQELERR
jgi:hypothetical protein